MRPLPDMGRFTRFSTPSLFVLHTSGETHYWRPCLNATVIIGSFSFRKRNPRIRAYHAAAAFIASMVIWPTRALAAHAMEWIAYAPYAFASNMKHAGHYWLACSPRGPFPSPAPARLPRLTEPSAGSRSLYGFSEDLDDSLAE